jgi:hypothetical protein
MNQPEFIISAETGQKILVWCISGAEEKSNLVLGEDNILQKELYQQIQLCNSVSELLQLYKKHPNFQSVMKQDFETRKSFLMKLINPQKFTPNGKYN